MKGDDVLISFGPSQKRLDMEKLLLEGKYPGSCGAAVITKNILAKNLTEGGSSIRPVERGTLVLVWTYHDEVRFSTASEENIAIEQDCLVCKSADLARVPGPLWGAMFPLSADFRIAIATNERWAMRLAALDVASTVDIVGSQNEYLATATIGFKNEVPGLKAGVYYGINILDSQEPVDKIKKMICLIPSGCQSYLPGFDAVVSLRHLRPSGCTSMQTFQSSLELELDDGQVHIPKSVSQHTLRSTEEVSSRRNASRSLDLTNKTRSEKLLNIDNFGSDTFEYLSKTTSRSLDLPPSTSRRLTRGRACASLDSPLAKGTSTDIGPDDCGDDELTVGSVIELNLHGNPYYGVIRWIGYLQDGRSQRMAGLEMEEELERDENTRGLFECPPFKALFAPLSKCRRDPRFQEGARRRTVLAPSAFGQIECPPVEGTIPPISVDLKTICGKNRGIQGHHNSCYLDATLFSMFAFTSVFDSLLYRPASKTDIPEYEEVQRVLRDEIVNPLRRNLYTRADRVMKLRTLLEQLSSVTGLTSEEKDPEEFLNSLLAQILKADPFLKLNSGQDGFHYQLFVEKDDRLTVPSVQQLLEQSFLASDIKLKQLPPCLIVQMPRFGKAFKMYPRILPSTILDVTDVIENSPRQCTICGKLALLECRDCYLDGLEGGGFCAVCLEKAHSHPLRSRHKARTLDVPLEFRELQEHCAVPRLYMHLFAVVCIETSHYVTFLNTDRGWVFFDSMADRKGEQNGYNIPEIVLCPELPILLSEKGARKLEEMQELPELAKRLVCDAYMCMYQSPDVMMYR